MNAQAEVQKNRKLASCMLPATQPTLVSTCQLHRWHSNDTIPCTIQELHASGDLPNIGLSMPLQYVRNQRYLSVRALCAGARDFHAAARGIPTRATLHAQACVRDGTTAYQSHSKSHSIHASHTHATEACSSPPAIQASARINVLAVHGHRSNTWPHAMMQ